MKFHIQSSRDPNVTCFLHNFDEYLLGRNYELNSNLIGHVRFYMWFLIFVTLIASFNFSMVSEQSQTY